jgi:hypothetical protein
MIYFPSSLFFALSSPQKKLSLSVRVERDEKEKREDIFLTEVSKYRKTDH